LERKIFNENKKIMKNQISVAVIDGKISVTGPYSESNNDTWRSLGGKFVSGSWNIPDNDTTRNVVAELFGPKSEDVEVLVPLSVCCGYDRLQIGGYVLASRRGRDSRVEIPDGVSLVSGSFPKSAGSVKNPRVAAADDTVFRLCCRRTFAEKNGLEIAGCKPASIEI